MSLPREPRLENKYLFTMRDLFLVKVVDMEALQKTPFEYSYNEKNGYGVYKAHIFTCSEEERKRTDNWGDVTFFFQETLDKKSINSIYVRCCTNAGKYGYTFDSFFKPRTIESVYELEVQELVLSFFNSLVDKGVLSLPENYVENRRKSLEEMHEKFSANVTV